MNFYPCELIYRDENKAILRMTFDITNRDF